MMRSGSVVVGAVALAALLTGCNGSSKHTAAPPAPTPITKLDASAVRLARVPFCDRVPAAAVRRALGAAATADQSWGNGDPLSGQSGSGDVGNEIGCTWTGPGRTAASAWVFGRPVTADFAGTLVPAAGHRKGCTAGPTTTFGSPALLQTCTLPGGAERIRRAGLFGDTWLTCEVSGPASASLRSRADDWCAAVVAALRTSAG